ncbi:MAG: hypothetical protein ACR2QX_09820 [Woeseiaceae bacterium]
MISRLQQHLTDIYQAGAGYDVRDYLITDPRLAKCIGEDAMLTDSKETLLIAEDDDGLALSLFLDAELLERLESSDPLGRLRAELLDDLWKVVEGVSHFNCVVWKASQDRNVSLLELELQAEIDKFVSTMLLAVSQGRCDMLDHVHGWLFDDVSYHDELNAEQLDRYRAANEYASRFCHALRRRLVEDVERVLGELRRFYRLPMTDKISHIHSQALSAI